MGILEEASSSSIRIRLLGGIMITGITILNTYDTQDIPIFLAIFLMIAGLAVIALGIDLMSEKEYIGGIMALLVGVFILAVGFAHTIDPNVSHNVDALIDPQTPFIDVYENYEVKDKRGEIYHLILKQDPDVTANDG